MFVKLKGSRDSPKLVRGQTLWQPLASQAYVLIEHDVRFVTGVALLRASAHLVSLPLRPDCLLVARIHDLYLVFLPRNCHLVKVLLSLFEDALHSEERRCNVSLE